MRSPPWYARWERGSLQGYVVPPLSWRRTEKSQKWAEKHGEPWEKYDLMKQYRSALFFKFESEIVILCILQKNCSGGGAKGNLRRGLFGVAPNGVGQEKDEEEEDFRQTQENLEKNKKLLINISFICTTAILFLGLAHNTKFKNIFANKIRKINSNLFNKLVLFEFYVD